MRRHQVNEPARTRSEAKNPQEQKGPCTLFFHVCVQSPVPEQGSQIVRGQRHQGGQQPPAAGFDHERIRNYQGLHQPNRVADKGLLAEAFA